MIELKDEVTEEQAREILEQLKQRKVNIERQLLALEDEIKKSSVKLTEEQQKLKEQFELITKANRFEQLSQQLGLGTAQLRGIDRKIKEIEDILGKIK